MRYAVEPVVVLGVLSSILWKHFAKPDPHPKPTSSVWNRVQHATGDRPFYSPPTRASDG